MIPINNLAPPINCGSAEYTSFVNEKNQDSSAHEDSHSLSTEKEEHLAGDELQDEV